MQILTITFWCLILVPAATKPTISPMTTNITRLIQSHTPNTTTPLDKTNWTTKPSTQGRGPAQETSVIPTSKTTTAEEVPNLGFSGPRGEHGMAVSLLVSFVLCYKVIQGTQHIGLVSRRHSHVVSPSFLEFVR